MKKGQIYMSKKKKSGAGIVLLLLLVLAIIIILLLSLVNGKGLGQGDGDFSSEGGIGTETVTDAAENSVAESEIVTEADDNIVVIEISEDKILADGNECSDSNALREYLLNVKTDDTVYILKDNHAVKSVYDEAASVFDELGYEYSEEIK